jgi:hypothetical protein
LKSGYGGGAATTAADGAKGSAVAGTDASYGYSVLPYLDALQDVHHDGQKFLVLNHVIVILVRLRQDLPYLPVV